MSNPSKYKNVMGRYFLKGLFYEETLSDKSTVVYTLKREDHEGYPSLFRLYMEAADPTEYKFAVSHLGGWDHWQELSQCSWFKAYVKEWRDELLTRLRSEALAAIKAIAGTENHPSHFTANKYLLEATGKPVDAAKRGRPGKGSSLDEETHQRLSMAEINDDAKRVGLN